MLRNPACLEPLPENLFFPPKKGDYVYFEAAAFQAGAGFSIANASWAADAAMFAYARYGPQRMNDAEFRSILQGAGFTTAEPIGDCFASGATAARGFFAANDRHAILAFRGTEKDTLSDIEADLDAILVAEDAIAGRPRVAVHQGFQRYLRSIWQQTAELVAGYRRAHPDREICITGHSLGAALATLAFHRLQDPHTSLYTFGCPRVGAQAFCNDLMEMARTRGIYRVIDHEDAVTHVPIEIVLCKYRHPDCAVFWIDQAGRVTQNPPAAPGDPKMFQDLIVEVLRGKIENPLPRPVADHSPVRYCHWISQARA